ncbi:hypothetical protein Cgig2_002559 [Carnegiea gigantea]|uniref:Uncharacterized protein n=1 Tax=Carnegiea gigantea TaxID=171969 RepID=A0A9Q1GHK8_9CARY|nr:hypothetical protein Cgig2_002559 [Carnegiea gigantea]
MEQNVITQSGAQLVPSNGSPISDHELSEVKFIIPNRVAESYVLKSMGKKWSNFKADLKLEHYEPNCGNVSAIMNEHRPDCVSKDQWISLVTYWISDKGKTVNGVEPSRAHVYVDTLKDRKTRPAPMDEKSKQVVVRHDKRETKSNFQVVKRLQMGMLLEKEVVGEGRRGRVRGLGLGLSSLASLSSTQCGEHLDDDHDQCSERMEFLERRIKAWLRALVNDSMIDGATLSNSIGTENENVSLFVFNVFHIL